MSPVSRAPGSTKWNVRPMRSSPAIIAQLGQALPRNLGKSEPCALMIPNLKHATAALGINVGQFIVIATSDIDPARRSMCLSCSLLAQKNGQRDDSANKRNSSTPAVDSGEAGAVPT